MSLMQLLLFRTNLVYLEDITATGRNNGGRIVLDGSAGLNGANVEYTVSGINADRYTWLLAGTVNDYQIRATIVSGSPQGSATNTWLNCNTNPSWSVDASIFEAASLTFEIRDIATSTVQDSCSVSLSIVA